MPKSLDITVAVSQDFLSCIPKLPRQIQIKALKFAKEFQRNPTSPGYNYETIRNAHDKNMRSLRITGDYRAIILKPERGKTYLLLWIANHDEAYAWAERRRCLVHPDTGSLQIFTVDEPSERATAQALADPEAPAREPLAPQETGAPKKKEVSRLFGSYTGPQLQQLGVPPQLMYGVRQLEDREAFEEFGLKLPSDAYEALLFLLEGEAYNAVLDLVRDHGPILKDEVDQEDFASALAKPTSQQTFKVIEGGEEELERLWEAPLEKWRVFLHRSQTKLVKMDASGPVRVLGGAGTGKTVVAMHRAVHLARHVFAAENDRLLFTTFTSNLAADIQENLRALCPDPQVLARIEVVSLDGWVNRFLKQQGFQKRIHYFSNSQDGVLQDLWDEALLKAPANLNMPQEFYREEWEQVIQTHGIASEREYFRVARTGRGVGLGRTQRKQVWPVFEHYRQRMIDQGVCEREDALRAACHMLKEKGDILPYKSILVDEAQDMSNEAFKLLRQMVPVPQGQSRGNDIFIVGDGHQRIYNHRVVLGQCGIQIVGRSRRLKINYRTSDEIRRFAVSVLEGLEIDDLDGGMDTLQGYTSLVRGETPIIKLHDTFDQEIKTLEAMLKHEESHRQTCLVTRTTKLLEQYKSALGACGIKTYQLSRNKAEDRSKPGVRIATMHRVKGLEFDRVILAGINDGVIPLRSVIDQIQDEAIKEAKIMQERALFYVACTRAKRHVVITTSGPPSTLIS